jgi:hypothetical protein
MIFDIKESNNIKTLSLNNQLSSLNCDEEYEDCNLFKFVSLPLFEILNKFFENCLSTDKTCNLIELKLEKDSLY